MQPKVEWTFSHSNCGFLTISFSFFESELMAIGYYIVQRMYDEHVGVLQCAKWLNAADWTTELWTTILINDVTSDRWGVSIPFSIRIVLRRGRLRHPLRRRWRPSCAQSVAGRRPSHIQCCHLLQLVELLSTFQLIQCSMMQCCR